MSCLYSVRFLPDALCDYDDELIVESLATPLTVPIHARRLPPLLTCELLYLTLPLLLLLTRELPYLTLPLLLLLTRELPYLTLPSLLHTRELPYLTLPSLLHTRELPYLTLP